MLISLKVTLKGKEFTVPLAVESPSPGLGHLLYQLQPSSILLTVFSSYLLAISLALPI